MLIDTHAHLDYAAFLEAPGGLKAVLDRAESHGVSGVIAVATSIESARDCVAIARSHARVNATAGIHPTDESLPEAAADLDATRAALLDLIESGGVRALGETGLDHFRLSKHPEKAAPAKAAQEALFRMHLDLAAQTGLPVVVHQRACWNDAMRVLRDYEGRVRCVLHCFAGTLEQARLAIAMGHLVSFTGIVTFANGAETLAVAAALDPGQFMVETDAPYLAPEPHRGAPCEPWHVRLTSEKIAAARSESLDALAAHTTATARSFFRLD